MSNSIWHKPTVRPVKDCIVVWQNPAHMSFTLPRTARKYMEKYNCERWATLDDLIAQADKAERAIWWLKEIVENHRYTPITTAEMALKELDGANN